ncbi:MAG: SDR family oxidoreductase [Verrucomicrobiales bacterium]|nr:SDR family oxidoreductase [Verrucomicrobiales bacterium]
MDPDTRPVWITGARGLIGHHLARLASEPFPGRRIVPITRAEVELTDARALEARFEADPPGLVFHCAAMSRSPACQENPPLARAVNVGVTRHLAHLCANATLVFFSTDLVFDGTRGSYREDDPPRPLMVYGETKADAEAVVLQNPRHLVIRTSINAGRSPSGDRGFDEEMLNAWRTGKTLRLFADEFRTPIAAAETARAVLELARFGATGVVHVAGGQRLSRWEIGSLLAARYPDLHPKLERTSLRDFQGGPRPADVTLDCRKAESILGRPMPRFSDWVASNHSG